MPPKMNKDGYDFVQGIMRDVGAENAVRLAEMLYGQNVSLANARKVGKWASGEAAPNLQGTLKLLRLAGRLAEPGSKKRPGSSRRALDDSEILRALWDLAELQERQDELLFGLLDREVERRPPQRPAAEKKAGTSRGRRSA